LIRNHLKKGLKIKNEFFNSKNKGGIVKISKYKSNNAAFLIDLRIIEKSAF
jgi:hypothetical protein